MTGSLSTAPNAGLPVGLRKYAADAKLPHDEVDYGHSAGGDRCASCVNFIPGGPHCRIVADPIDPDGWCDRFEAATGATDSALTLALDRDSVRDYDRDGRLRVSRTHVSKANVCPYRGSEIPGWDELGLDPDKIYNLLRDPEELAKAAPTLNGVPLLRKHVPVSADEHQPYDVVGSLGTDAEFDGEYLDNSVFVNAREAIDGIESGRKRELSAGYHYKPDMTPGNFRGTAYDGVMRDIVFNHVALVEDGRAGPDVVVGDSAEGLNMSNRVFANRAMTIGSIYAYLAPRLAMDSKKPLGIAAAFDGVTAKNFSARKPAIVSAIAAVAKPKLAQDMDIEDLGKVVDLLEAHEISEGGDESVSQEQHNAMEAAAHGTSQLGIPKSVGQEFEKADKGKTFDAEPFKAFLREKGMGEDDIMKACDMMPKSALAGDEEETEEEKAAKAKEAEAAAAKDAEMKDMVTQPAMDAAIKIAVETAVASTAKQVRDTERGIRAALAEVHPWTGDIPASMAFDSAADVYRHALTMRGVEGAKTLHADALLPILRTMPKPGARPVERDTALAMDAGVVGKAIAMAPDLANISTTL